MKLYSFLGAWFLKPGMKITIHEKDICSEGIQLLNKYEPKPTL